ncbi:glycosyltransferase family 4 protein [Cellulophaga sp. HaHa_2_95]|uniref:glycosyltransferase family 4 protein n=1 Tax=Cellulophaga sp. HaHa_2_95 TaxID=2745558 RepID=UPI001C4E50F5|nr:glycosyltransferase family 4 protein [Cellulophaga sp. HaHa_2_95]QXP55245.1 glycosyltransferase family 4 protein [Cellulophaga sp. HaHa_2_95]
MKCLHICNDFSLTKVHSNLYKNLDKLNIEQIIYNPIRKATPVGNNSINFINTKSKIIYSNELKNYHRVLYRKKINFLKKDILQKDNLDAVNIIHATTLFSDGGLAYELHKELNIPFVVAIRATDITAFLKYRKDLISYGLKILKSASRLIFISDSLKSNFLNHPSICKIKTSLEHKCVIQYNGIDDYWLDNIFTKKIDLPNRIVYVGRLIPRKNVLKLANAIIEINNDKKLNLSLDIIGSGGSDEQKLIEISNRNPRVVNMIGQVSDRNKLLEHYRENHIFAMPSLGETFGLVYIEALSQGLPLLYTKNEGIDNVFDFLIGENSKSKTQEEIKLSLIEIIENYNNYDLTQINFNLFRWDQIANKYKILFESI